VLPGGASQPGAGATQPFKANAAASPLHRCCAGVAMSPSHFDTAAAAAAHRIMGFRVLPSAK